MNEIVKAEHLTMKYQTKRGEVEAIRNLSFSVYEGEFVSIVGPSGCGKSTLFSIIAGLIPQTSGKITIAGREVCGPARNIGYMLQNDHLFEWRTIFQNVLLSPEIRGKVTAEDREYAETLLKKYGLGEFGKNYPKEL